MYCKDSMKKLRKIFYSILLGGVLWASVQALFILRIVPMSNYYTQGLVFWFMYFVLGAVLFIAIKAVSYVDFIYLVISIAMYQALNFINFIVDFIFISESQFYLPSYLISGTFFNSALMFIICASSGTITIMVNKRILNKGLDNESMEKENGDDLINED